MGKKAPIDIREYIEGGPRFFARGGLHDFEALQLIGLSSYKKILVYTWLLSVAVTDSEIVPQPLVLFTNYKDIKTDVKVSGRYESWWDDFNYTLFERKNGIYESKPIHRSEDIPKADIIIDADYNRPRCSNSKLPAFYGNGLLINFLCSLNNVIVVVKRGLLLLNNPLHCDDRRRRLIIYDAEKGIINAREIWVSDAVAGDEEELKNLLEELYKRFFP